MKRCVLSMALLCCIQFSSSSQFRHFERDNSLNHYSCDPDDLVIVEEYSLNKCAGMCLLFVTNCTSFFWNPSYNTCYGCRNTYTSASGLPLDTGARYFFKYSDYGELCTDDWQCPGQYQGCLEVEDEKMCRCSPGYPFDPTSGECVTDCAVYGDTFQVYKWRNLNGNKIKTERGVKHVNMGANCRKACTESTVTCRSIDHTAMLFGICTLNEDTAATASLPISVLAYYHYQRNCA